MPPRAVPFMGERKKVSVIGILAHVDAGKTTLSEALLYETGQIRSLGRVDHGDTFLDTDVQEKERGITIFSKQARINYGGHTMTLLDTPGHVDFSAEMERTLQVLDGAVLVISGTDGVQSHTRTLWRLLKHYGIPTILFINKMDLAEKTRMQLQQELREKLSDACVDFTCLPEVYEDLAVCREDILNRYMETGTVGKEDIKSAFKERMIFPCFYGSALKMEGVKELLEGMASYIPLYEGGTDFAARVYKIGRDPRGVRLTYLKVLGGKLGVKEKICYGSKEEKVNEIRLYSGEKFENTEAVKAGEVCVATGLTETFPGQGLGTAEDIKTPVLEPVLNYQVLLPKDVNPSDMLLKLRQIEEEDPQLHVVWSEELREIHVQMMGEVQIEVLTRIILDRFGIAVLFGPGSIVYKETIAKAVEGVGHFEPLRHYAEVHILMEPGEPQSGIQVTSRCSEDVLDLNWQRLIATHIEEREHRGVLTGSPVTDIKFTIVGGRAHNKHTEGGDFRQATYRAIRQGLKSTESVLLEPYYNFTLEVPVDALGRGMTDLKQRFARMENPEYRTEAGMDFAVVKGSAPVATIHDYAKEVNAYTKGVGHIALELSGYDVCHNSEEVIDEMGYDSEQDVANPTSSVFCAHGAGFLVPWNEVPTYMHVDYVTHPAEEDKTEEAGRSYDIGEQRFSSEVKQAKSLSDYELDRELQAIYAREFGMSRNDVEEQERKKWMKKVKATTSGEPKLDKKGNPIYPKKNNREELLIVDGYNIIFAWEDLKELSKVNIDAARDKLLDELSNYQGFCGHRVIVVFDAYKVQGRATSASRYRNLEVVYTKTDEIADVYIERLVHEVRDKYNITVATNDNLEQMTIMSLGGLRLSAEGLRQELQRVRKNINEFLR